MPLVVSQGLCAASDELRPFIEQFPRLGKCFVRVRTDGQAAGVGGWAAGARVVRARQRAKGARKRAGDD